MPAINNSYFNPNEEIKYSNYLIFLSMLYLVFFLSSAILAHKLVYFGHYMTSVSTFVLPFTFVITDIIAEIYGYTISKKLLLSAFICEFVFSIIMIIAVNIHSPEVLQNSNAYKIVFSSFIRIFIGNIVAMMCSILLNVCVITRTKILLKGRFFWLRSLMASIVGEFTFTFICVIIAFIGVIPINKIPQLILTSFIFKIIFNPIGIIPASFAVSYLRTYEGENTIPFKYEEEKLDPFNHGAVCRELNKI